MMSKWNYIKSPVHKGRHELRLRFEWHKIYHTHNEHENCYRRRGGRPLMRTWRHFINHPLSLTEIGWNMTTTMLVDEESHFECELELIPFWAHHRQNLPPTPRLNYSLCVCVLCVHASIDKIFSLANIMTFNFSLISSSFRLHASIFSMPNIPIIPSYNTIKMLNFFYSI